MIFLLLAVLALATSAGFATVSFLRQIPSTATIATVGVNVYSDAACTQNVTNIAWGTLYPGSITNDLVYIQSTSTVQITLSLSTGSWNPAAAGSYVSLSWNYTAGTEIQPNASIPVLLTLNVSSAATGITSFSFNIDITGSG